jgi:hypothetical protein
LGLYTYREAEEMERCLKDEAADLQMKLGKKATFEDAVKKLTVLVSSKYQLADPEGRKAVSASNFGRDFILLKSNGSKHVDGLVMLSDQKPLLPAEHFLKLLGEFCMLEATFYPFAVTC